MSRPLQYLLLALTGSGCSLHGSYGAADLGQSTLVQLGSTEPVLADAHAVIRVQFTARRHNGAVVPNLTVRVFSNDDCLIIQPSGPSDANGQVTAQVTSHLPGSKRLYVQVTSYSFSENLPTGLTVHFVDSTTLLNGGQGILNLGALAAQPIVGVPTSLTIIANDGFGSLNKSFSGTVKFISSDGNAILPADYQFTAADAGQHTFVNGFTFTQAGAVSLMVTSLDNAPAQSRLTVQGGAATAIVVTLGATGVAGDAVDLAVRVVDAFGNVIPSYVGSLHFTSSDPQATLPPDIALTSADKGQKSLSRALILRTAGLQTVTATVGGTASFFGTGRTAQPILAGGLAQFTLGLSSSTPVAAISQDLTLTAADAFGNQVSSYAGNVFFLSSDPAARLPGITPMTPSDAGQKFLPAAVTLYLAGSQTVSASDTVASLHGSVTPMVQPGPVASLQVTSHANSVVAGQTLQVTVAAMDAQGNLVPTYNGNVTLASSDAMATPGSHQFIVGDGGTYTFSSGIVLRTGGAQSLSATGSQGESGSLAGLAVTPAAPSQLGILSSLTTSEACLPGSPTVQVAIQDIYGNTVTDPVARRPIRIGTLGNSNGALLAGTLVQISQAGVATFPDLALSRIGSYRLQATASGLAPAVSPFFNVAVSNLSIVSAGGMTGSTVLQVPYRLSANCPVDLKVELDPSGTGPFSTATQAAGGTAGVVRQHQTQGQVLNYSWDASHDLKRSRLTQARLRITASAGGASTSLMLSNLALNYGIAFAAAAPQARPEPQQALALGDLNHDGVADLVAINPIAATLSVALGNATGSFAAPSFTAVAAAPSRVLTGDVNRDGRPDVLILHSNSSQCLSILLGQANGSLGIPIVSACAGIPQEMILVDVNHDGNLDIVYTDNTLGGSVQTRLGSRNGTFAVATQAPVGPGLVGLAVADVSQDGWPDALVSLSSNAVAVLLGSSSGFGVPSFTPVPAGANGLAVADFNRDGRPDLAVACNAGVATLLGDGLGGLAGLQLTAVGATGSLIAADLDNDGQMDLAATAPGSGQVLGLSGLGNGTFLTPVVTATTGAQPQALLAADLNHDSALDLLTANGGGSLSVLLSSRIRPSTSLAAARLVSLGTSMVGSAVDDFNEDGYPDLLVSNGSDNTLSLALGNGGSNWQVSSTITQAGANPFVPVAADMNGDGHLDVVVSNVSSAQVTVLLGDGRGNLTGAGSFNVGVTPQRLQVADFDRDGRLDILVPNSSSGTATVLLADGRGGYVGTDYAVGMGARSLAVGDLNLDGTLDFAVLSSNENAVDLYFGDGAGHFTHSAERPLCDSNGAFISLGDFNEDGRLDLVVAISNGNINLMMSQITGTTLFSAPTSLASANGHAGILAVDQNLDGHMDLVGIDGGQRIYLTLGDGSGIASNFRSSSLYGYSFNSSDFQLHDVNGDGVVDMIATVTGQDLQIILSDVHASWQAPMTSSGGSPIAPSTWANYVGVEGAVVHVADFNHTGRNQVYDTTMREQNMWAWDASLGMVNLPIVWAGYGIQFTSIGDINNDGWLDVIGNAETGGNYNGNAAYLLSQNKNQNLSQNWAAGSSSSSGFGGTDATSILQDINGDGNVDYLGFGFGVNLQMGDGHGHFGNPNRIAFGCFGGQSAVVDLNNDGAVDIVSSCVDASKVNVLLGDGTGRFAFASTPTYPYWGGADVVGDFNHDGIQDVAVLGIRGGNLSIGLGAGDGTFPIWRILPLSAPREYYAGYIPPYSLGTADLDFDGNLDLAIPGGHNGAVIYVYRGDGQGNFSGPSSYVVGVNPVSTAFGDIDGDGTMDIAVGNKGYDYANYNEVGTMVFRNP